MGHFEPLCGTTLWTQWWTVDKHQPKTLMEVILELTDIGATLEGQPEGRKAQPPCRTHLCWNGLGPRTQRSPNTVWLASLRQVT